MLINFSPCLEGTIYEVKTEQATIRDKIEEDTKMERPGKMATMALFAVIFVMFCATGAVARDKGSPDAKKPTVYREQARTMTATVQAIDLRNRIVRVKGGPKDHVFELKVDKGVQNLDRLRVGDRVVVNYIEAIAVRVIKPEEDKALSFEKKVEPEGRGVEVRQTTVTARIAYIDRNTNNVYLTWPDGVTVGVRAKDPKVLENFKDGEWIEITYTDTLAISIEKTKP